MATKMSLIELKKRLSVKTHAELVEEIVQLNKKFPAVKEYYQSILLGDESEIIDKYKKIIKGEFLMRGNRFPEMRLSVARKAVMDFKKISKSPLNIADMMVSYVEVGVICTVEFGDIDELFYNSMERMYETALNYAIKEHLFAEFHDRLRAIVNDTRGMGWGFHDQLSDLYEQYKAKVNDLQPQIA